MNLTKKFENNKEQIIEKIKNMFNSFDICSIDCEYHNRFVEYYTLAVYTINNNISGTYLNSRHKEIVNYIEYSTNATNGDVNVDTDFIFYFYPNCVQLYMQCYIDSSVYNQIHLKTIYTTEIDNLIK